MISESFCHSGPEMLKPPGKVTLVDVIRFHPYSQKPWTKSFMTWGQLLTPLNSTL